ncbi:MAG: hypothetical protein QOH63_3211 [Acidobacteriota bacterium]|nr:hypothetical protein [Acidobacteriota bacterium]
MLTKVTYLKGSTKRICQLTGERDRERGTAAFNKTETNWGLIGTDLGASFDDGARTYFLFGDSHPNHPDDTYRPTDGDAIAYTTDTNPEPGIKLTFITAPDGHNYRSPSVPGVDPGSFNVPVGGFVVGADKYIFFTTGNTLTTKNGHAVLAVTKDFINFEKVYSLPALSPHEKTPLIDICPLVVDNSTIPGLPDSTGHGVLLWGSGQHRQSNPHLAYQPRQSLRDRNTIRYFAGLNGNTPRWDKMPENASPLFDHPYLGELSVTYNKFLRRWVMLYNSSDVNKPWIICRVAETPWGPWSDGETIFNPCTEGGFCHFIHYNGTPPRDPQCHDLQPCPEKHLSDTGRESEIGGPYGPYQISRYAKAAPNGTTIYWAMSTWNPYNVMLMKSTLVMA